MAYRFNGTSDKVEFAIAPVAGLFGNCTFAVFLKRSATSTFQAFIDIATSGGSDYFFCQFNNSDALRFFRNTQTLGPTLSSTSLWYLIVITAQSSGGFARFHVHNGTSWSHSDSAPSLTGSVTVAGTDRLVVGGLAGSGSFPGDIVCVGIKRTQATDLQVETLSRTAFSAWQAFGFDWLIGFDTSLQTAGVLQHQASPGTGHQAAISGTSVVADPRGWSWGAAAAPFVPKIIIS
jgi:hypothetical protein